MELRLRRGEVTQLGLRIADRKAPRSQKCNRSPVITTELEEKKKQERQVAQVAEQGNIGDLDADVDVQVETPVQEWEHSLG